MHISVGLGKVDNLACVCSLSPASRVLYQSWGRVGVKYIAIVFLFVCLFVLQ